MIATVTIALAVIVFGVRGAFRLRDRKLAAMGCPQCGGPLTVKGPVFGCRACRHLWTASGFELVLLRTAPVDLLPLPEEVPRAAARLKEPE